MKTSVKLLTAVCCLALASGGCSERRKANEEARKAAEQAARDGDKGAEGTREISGGTINIAGSSTVFPVTQAVAEEFKNQGKGEVTIASTGTGGGFKKFCRGETAITGASRPVKQVEREKCKEGGVEFIELPVAYDGLAVVVHKDNTWVDHMTTAELHTMWAPESKDTVKKWSQVRKGWPDEEFHLFGPGTDSGTFDYFTQAINGKEQASRGDFQPNEDDHVLVQGIAGDKNALGYFGYAYYVANTDKLKIVPIDDGNDDNGKGPITPSAETVADGTYQPLSRPIFIYVSVAATNRTEVQAFVDLYLGPKGRELVAKVGYIPLPEKAYTLTIERFKKRTTGSLFEGGSRTGVTVEQLLGGES